MTCCESLSVDLRLVEKVFRKITRTINKKEIFYKLIKRKIEWNEMKSLSSQIDRIDVKIHSISNINETKTTKKTVRIDRLACNAVQCRAD